MRPTLRALASALYRRALPLPVAGSVVRTLAPHARRWLWRPPAPSAQILEAHAAALAALRAHLVALHNRLGALELRLKKHEKEEDGE